MFREARFFLPAKNLHFSIERKFQKHVFKGNSESFSAFFFGIFPKTRAFLRSFQHFLGKFERQIIPAFAGHWSYNLGSIFILLDCSD